MKNLGNAGKAHNTIYIYIYIQHLYNEWNLSTRPHTHTDTLLKKCLCIWAYNRFVVGVFFCTQNLIRDG